MIRWLLVGLSLASGSAFALTCGRMEKIYPPDGAKNVPLNMAIRMTYPSASGLGVTLSDSAGADIPLVTQLQFGGRVGAFFPLAELQPGAEYVIRPSSGLPQRFTTGSHRDVDAPAAPQFDYATLETPGTPGSYRKWRLQLISASDPTATNDQLLLLVHDAKSPDFVIGATDVLQPTLDVETCGNNFAPPEGDSFDLAIQTLDLAGNVSEFSAANGIEAQKRGCSVAPAGAWLMVAATLLLRRRSSRS